MRGFLSTFTASLLVGLVACGGNAFSSGAPGDSDGGIDATMPGNDATSGDGGPCTPTSCAANHWLCGTGDDGCGGTLDCGGCHTAGFHCDTRHECACAPKSCTDLGFECGSAGDGCGSVIMCGDCDAGTCGGGGDHKCGSGTCMPKTCQPHQCGLPSDGCGGTLDCGGCPTPESCGGGGVANVCGCTPNTCKQLGIQCGQADDGCGGTLQCGGCPSNETCNAGVCGCKPLTCQGLGWACGSGSDGCGGTLQCGACTTGTCDPSSHKCAGCTPKQTCQSLGYDCGSFIDSCGTTETCGAPPSRESINDPLCTDGTHSHYYACTCAVPGAPMPAAPIFPDGGAATCGGGPTPPEPMWDCLPMASSGNMTSAWCCTQ